MSSKGNITFMFLCTLSVLNVFTCSTGKKNRADWIQRRHSSSLANDKMQVRLSVFFRRIILKLLLREKKRQKIQLMSELSE